MKHELTPDDKLMMELQRRMGEVDIRSFWTHDYLSLQWLILLAAFILPWLIFYKLARRQQLPELLLFGTWVALISELLDHIGFELGLWFYPVELAPLFPRFEEVNLSTLPVAYMLIYQYFPAWKGYTVAIAVMAALFTMVAEPALAYLGLYLPLRWEYYYGVPIYIAIGLFIKWLVGRVYAAAGRQGR